MKKWIKILTICLLVIMATAVVSCGENHNVLKNNDDLKGEITVLTDKRHEQSLNIAIKNFKKIHEKVEVNLKAEDNSYAVFQQSVKSKDSRIDIISIEDAYVQYYIDKLPDAFLDVSQDIGIYKDKVSKSKIDNLSVKNRVYGFPWSTCPKVIAYRSDILSSKGININDIKTWNDYIEMGKKLSKDTEKKILGNIKDENNDIHLLLANELGISYFNKDNNLNFNSKEWTKVVETVKRLYSENIIYDLSSKEAVIDAAQKEQIISFIADPYYISYFIEKVPSEKGKWSIINFPAFEPGGNRDVSLGGCNLMINKISSNAKLSREFVKFAVTNENTAVEVMKKQGTLSTVTDIYNLVEFNRVEDYFRNTVWSLLGNTEKGALPVVYTPYFFEIRDGVKNALSEGSLKVNDTKTILDSLQKELEQKMKQK